MELTVETRHLTPAGEEYEDILKKSVEREAGYRCAVVRVCVCEGQIN